MIRSFIIFSLVILALIAGYFWFRSTFSPGVLKPGGEEGQTTPILPGGSSLPSTPSAGGGSSLDYGLSGDVSNKEGVKVAANSLYQNPISDFVPTGDSFYLFDMVENKLKLWVDQNNATDILDGQDIDVIKFSPPVIVYSQQGQWHNYNTETETNTVVPNVLSADIFPDSTDLAVHYLDGQNGVNEIRLINVGKNSSRTLFSGRFEEIKLAAVRSGKILIFEKPSASVLSALYLLTFDPKSSKSAGTLNIVFPESRALEAIASPDGRYILVSYLESGGVLNNAVIDFSGKILARPDFRTPASKCAFASGTSLIICAKSANDLSLNNFDSYLRDETGLNTRFAVFDISKASTLELADSYFNFDVDKITANFTDGSLAFLNHNDRKFYSFILPAEVLVEKEVKKTSP